MPGGALAGASSRGTEPGTRGVTPGYTGGRGGYGPVSGPVPDAQRIGLSGFGTESEARKRVSVTCRLLLGLHFVFFGANQRVLTTRTGRIPGPGITK